MDEITRFSLGPKLLSFPSKVVSFNSCPNNPHRPLFAHETRFNRLTLALPSCHGSTWFNSSNQVSTSLTCEPYNLLHYISCISLTDGIGR
jgi:hypothetical protein